ncbi:TonB-dependent receptor domain-containing protein [Tenacibaculum sp. TC6]|uniref:TonB-dependent receptor domain-containing protein n=1 Tax=Tenacibaculum sp. TC6 TaxID=3423223 RepID=UPI003D35ECFE
MKRILLTLTLIINSFLSFSQINISGIVKDSVSNIEFANVFLKDINNNIVTGSITNEKGFFKIEVKKGKYIIVVSFIGYKDWNKEILVEGNNISLGNIQLIQNENRLDEVIISAKKPLIQKKVDRLIFNVENSIISQGADGLEVLQRTPRIDISSSGVKIIGKSSVNILVDGRMLNLSSSDLEAYLRGIRSDNISKIEVITSPPAKYDAEGNSGLINIITKKNPNLGWDGSIGATYIQRTYSAFIPTSNIKFANKKLNISLNVSADTEAKKSVSTNDIEYDSRFWNTSRNRKDSSKGLMLNLNSNYKINKKSETGFIYSGSFWDINQKGNNLSNFIQKENYALDSILMTKTKNKNEYGFHSINGYYDLKLDSIGKKFSLNIDYLVKNSSNDINFNSIGMSSNGAKNSETSVLNKSDNKYEVVSLGTDFTLPYKTLNVEIGGKLTFINNNSSLFYYDIASGDPIINLSRTNQFEYKEKTSALYISIEKELSEKWITQIGLRYENTYLKGFSPTLNQTNTNTLNNVFPSAYVSYDPKENHSLSISYSKRIDRPGFSNLNPFRVYSDPYSYDSGNPFLEPSFTHNLEFSYIYKNNLSLTLYASKLIDVIDFITLTDENSNEIISQPENLYNQLTYGLDISHRLTLFKWFNSYNSLSTYFNRANSNFEDETLTSYNGYGTYFSTKNTITLNKKRTSFFTINFFQSFPNVDGFFKSRNRASLDLGLKFKLLEDNLQVNISGNDLFKQNRNVGKEQYQNFTQFSSIYNDMRNFTISLSYKIGSKNVRQGRRKSKYNEDKQRLN